MDQQKCKGYYYDFNNADRQTLVMCWPKEIEVLVLKDLRSFEGGKKKIWG